MDIVGLGIFIAYMAFTILVIIQYLRIRNNNKQLQFDNAQLLLDRSELFKKLEQALNINGGVEKTDGFLRFISESRDAAFKYIEDIQEALREYDIALSIDDAKLKNDAYKKLIALLPDDNVVK